MTEKFANSPGLRPSGVLDLKYWSFGCLVDPPLPPQWAPGAQKCEDQCLSWSPGRSIFRSFFQLDFGLDFGLVLAPFWARLGRLLGSFLEPKSGQVGPKIHLEPVFFQKRRFSRNITFSNRKWPKPTARRSQDLPKIAPRRCYNQPKQQRFLKIVL